MEFYLSRLSALFSNICQKKGLRISAGLSSIMHKFVFCWEFLLESTVLLSLFLGGRFLCGGGFPFAGLLLGFGFFGRFHLFGGAG